MLIGNTDLMGDDSIDIDLGGNISINYDCEAEEYARMAEANAVKQNKYIHTKGNHRRCELRPELVVRLE